MTRAGAGPDPVAWLPVEDWMRAPEVLAVLDALERVGAQARFVGGAVRDLAMGRATTSADIDIATDAEPDRVTGALAAAGLKTVPTGIEHGTVTAVSGGRGFEVTTLRRDVATDGRRRDRVVDCRPALGLADRSLPAGPRRRWRNRRSLDRSVARGPASLGSRSSRHSS